MQKVCYAGENKWKKGKTMGKGFFNIAKPSYIKTVSFGVCKDANERELKRKQFISDNAVFLNSALALVTDRDKPFLYEQDLKNFLNYMQSKRPEVQDRIQTLSYIRENRNDWFADGSYQEKKNNIITIFEYLLDNEIMFERSAECLNQEPDINLAVKKAITLPSFSLHEETNPAKLAWDKLSQKTQEVFKPQDLYQTL